MGTTITLSATDGHELSAYRAEPADPASGAVKGGVVVIQEIFGVNDHIRDVTDRFAAEGWLAVAPALFDRHQRDVELDYDGHGMEVGRDLAWDRLDLDTVSLDVHAAVGAAAVAGGVGVVGFCFGGMVACLSAIQIGRDVAAAVGYYPSRAAELLADRTPEAPLMLHVGDRDGRVTAEDVATMTRAWPDAVIHHYDADHGFNCDRRDTYDSEASVAAWGRTNQFLAEHLTPS